jgi:hypothetical protein
MILIIGTADDEQIRHVADRLDERGSKYVQFDPRHYPASAELTVEYDDAGGSRGVLTLPGETLELSEVRAAWHRGRVRPIPASNVREDQAWWVAESCVRFLSQVYECLDCLWIPERPASQREAVRWSDSDAPPCDAWVTLPASGQAPSAENKLYQLSVAGRVGLAVPRTLVTNSPERFLDFYEACAGELISKRAVDLIPRVGGKVTRPFTVSVERRDAANHRVVRHGPVVFQEKVPKRIELRVTVVGTRVFAAEIRSQDSQRQQTDWRHRPEYGQSRFYAVHSLPANVARQCVHLVKALNLTFGALDLILTPDDRYVFLEVNSNGQWAYIENILGLPISDAIAELLTHGHN